MPIATVNPATGETLRTFEPYDRSEVARRLDLAQSAWQGWRRTSFAERAALMNRLADIFESDVDQIGRVMTTEMGKTLEAAKGEVRKCAGGCPLLRRARPRGSSRPSRHRTPERKKASYSVYQPLGACWRSCRGTSRCGR